MSDQQHAQKPVRILRLREVCRRVGYSEMHLWRLQKAGRFPMRIKLGPNSVGFVESEVDDWLSTRIAERDRQLNSKRSEEP